MVASGCQASELECAKTTLSKALLAKIRGMLTTCHRYFGKTREQLRRQDGSVKAQPQPYNLRSYDRHTALTLKRTAAAKRAARAGTDPEKIMTQQSTAAGHQANASGSEGEDIAPVREDDVSGKSFDEASAART
ncbi:hypothetical protein HPB52_009017 [Rhipicephalus sanguineus]|uniref:Uncharacterized protein n=1 Tax=Rhipicephalus sanguineus TaxID=34632 RepID=A0A9D4Q6I8_RHISA|nr:hypothetical protein HPB52_009017 [Rhipicephalus sanguineus]